MKKILIIIIPLIIIITIVLLIVFLGNGTDNGLFKTEFKGEIGDEYGGGYVFYQDDEITLIAAKEDIEIDEEDEFQWGCYRTEIGEKAQGKAIGTGKDNTKAIVQAGCIEPGNTAVLCDNYEAGGYTDWFLPSKDELNKMCENLHKNGIGDFIDNYYWSSSEENSIDAWRQYFVFGYQDHNYKFFTHRVRCARAI